MHSWRQRSTDVPCCSSEAHRSSVSKNPVLPTLLARLGTASSLFFSLAATDSLFPPPSLPHINPFSCLVHLDFPASQSVESFPFGLHAHFFSRSGKRGAVAPFSSHEEFQARFCLCSSRHDFNHIHYTIIFLCNSPSSSPEGYYYRNSRLQIVANLRP